MRQFFSSLMLGAMMLVVAGVSVALRPTAKIADVLGAVELERMIPSHFSGWQIDASVLPVTVSPDVQAKLDKIYNQTLSRTYVNSSGQRVMLSIAYGGDQSDALSMHRPEVCYAFQGFQVSQAIYGVVQLLKEQLPVVRLVATHGARNEPITYWVLVGQEAVQTRWQQKLAQLRFGFTGKIPDGMLVRLSSIDRDQKRAYAVQEDFARALVEAVDPKVKMRLIGHLS